MFPLRVAPERLSSLNDIVTIHVYINPLVTHENVGAIRSCFVVVVKVEETPLA